MRVLRLLPVLATAFAVVAAPAAAPARAAEPYQSLLDTKADMVVSVKFVLTISITMGGGSRDNEVSGNATGILVDKSGLVMIPNSSINPSFGGRGGRGMEMKSVPSDFRVTFAGDTKEYAAILGASDSKVGLAFIRIKDLEGKEVRPLVVENAANPEIGDVLYGVSRQPQGFDYAPYVADCRVSGRIQKPRELLDINGDFLQVAHPLFTKDGVVAGIVVTQEGVGGGAGTFLLPWKTASGTIQRAQKQTETALEELRAKEAEDAAKAAEEGGEKGPDKPAEPAPEKPAEEPAPGTPGSPGDGTK
jgi:hypothetical protein